MSRYFEYDSDGARVVMLNKGLLLSDQLNYREHQIDFSKANLISYKIRNYLVYKTLTIKYKSDRGSTKKATFNVTLVTKKKLKYIGQSLRKIIKNQTKQQNTQ